jgi:hypothetical protein
MAFSASICHSQLTGKRSDGQHDFLQNLIRIGKTGSGKTGPFSTSDQNTNRSMLGAYKHSYVCFYAYTLAANQLTICSEEKDRDCTTAVKQQKTSV